MDAVQAVYDDLGELFDEHAGFDADGEVTDDSLAVYTLRQIADGLLDLHQLGEDARFELTLGFDGVSVWQAGGGLKFFPRLLND